MTPRRFAVVLVQLAATALAVAAALVLVLPRLLGWEGVVVLSGSMEPALPVGAVAFVGKAAPERVDVGDVLTFTRPDGRGRGRVTHRVVEVLDTPEGRRFRTQGDANGTPDAALVRPEQVVGTVQATVPHLGGFAQAVADNRALVAIGMGLAAAVRITGDVRRRRPAPAVTTSS